MKGFPQKMNLCIKYKLTLLLDRLLYEHDKNRQTLFQKSDDTDSGYDFVWWDGTHIGNESSYSNWGKDEPK